MGRIFRFYLQHSLIRAIRVKDFGERHIQGWHHCLFNLLAVKFNKIFSNVATERYFCFDTPSLT
jgi:hypothetical protein